MCDLLSPPGPRTSTCDTTLALRRRNGLKSLKNKDDALSISQITCLTLSPLQTHGLLLRFKTTQNKLLFLLISHEHVTKLTHSLTVRRRRPRTRMDVSWNFLWSFTNERETIVNKDGVNGEKKRKTCDSLSLSLSLFLSLRHSPYMVYFLLLDPQYWAVPRCSF